MWTEIGVGPDPRAPPLGPLNLTPTPREAAATLPPLALVFDAMEIHRGVARASSPAGSPWRGTATTPTAHTPSAARARAPRHAAEIAAYLPRGASRGGGQPHPPPPARGRAAVRALEALAADAPPESCCSARLPLPASPPPLAACPSPMLRTPSTTPASTARRNPLVVVLAVGGDAAMETALERLLAGERGCSSAYVDRNLLAGSVLIATDLSPTSPRSRVASVSPRRGSPRRRRAGRGRRRRARGARYTSGAPRRTLGARRPPPP